MTSSTNWRLETDYCELIAEQRSEGWFRARKYRATASKYATLLGLQLRFESPDEAVQDILGLKPKKEPTKAMQLGTLNESGIRDTFCEKFGVKKVIEPSLCLSLRWFDFPCSWNNNKMLSEMYPSMLEDPEHCSWFIAGSPDGILEFSNGLKTNMEIKFTKDIYDPLKRKTDNMFFTTHRYTEYTNELLSKPFQHLVPKTGHMSNTGAVDSYPHIYISHLFQMTGCMFITNKTHCAYVVGSLEKEMYSEMVSYDENLWRYYVYPELIKIIETEIKPRLTSEQRKEFKESVQEIIDLCKKNNVTDTMINFKL